jgi:hypothetical protein
MRMILAVLAAMLSALVMLPAGAAAQTPQKSALFAVAGHPGAAHILQINGKSYVEIEALARLTQGSLSFNANQTTLTLLPAGAEAPPATPKKAGFSTAFVQASIEDLSFIREWRIAIVNAVLNNSPLAEEWVSAHSRLANKNLALASAAAATDDDHSAAPLLSAELNNMQKLSELYLAMRNQAALISPDTFNNAPLEEQILNCAKGFVSMTESHEFQDQPACH